MGEHFKINEDLAVGRGQPGETELRQLAGEGFRALIDLREDSESNGALAPAEEAAAARRLGLSYWHLAVPTDRLRSAMLDRFRDAVHSLPKPIFVHCASGQRSGSFALAAAAIESGLSGATLLARAAEADALYGSDSMQRKLRRYVDRQARRWHDALPPTTRRVEAQTPASLNRRIADQTRASIHYYAAHPAEIDARLGELDREWDMERTLEANAASLVFAGTLLGATLDRRFFVLPLLVSGFLLQHALQGWCPPVALFRRLGLRSAAEIERERAALKALRGDFRGLDDAALAMPARSRHASPMQHVSSLGATIVASLALAWAGGMLARLLRLPLLVGYLAAGVVLGPFTPGFVADQQAVEQLAEIGVALLLFGVGLHFSIRDLIAVWPIAVPGALLQVAASAGLGYGAARLIGFPASQAAILALCLAVASTVVATRALDERDALRTEAGRIALGWLVMQDLVIVCVLVLLPPGSADVSGSGAGLGLLLELAEVAVFVAAMLVLGRRLIPLLLAFTARDGSHELFRLAVLAIALGIAFLSTELIGISPALGAFFAGVVIAESDLSHQAAGESVPVQQVFTVLFFVSVGMLFDPGVLVRAPLAVAEIAASVVIGNAAITLALLLALRARPKSAAEVAGALAQIGEFSFILSALAAARGLLPAEARNLVLVAALVSIVLQPLVLRVAERFGAGLDGSAWLRRWHATRSTKPPAGEGPPLDRHAIVVGHGRVGSVVVEALRSAGARFIVIEQDLHAAELLRRDGLPVIYGDAAWPEVLEAARPEHARLLVIAVPGSGAARRILAAARRANPELDIVARTHSAEEAEWLASRSVGLVVMSERQTAREMADYARRQFGTRKT